MTQRTDSDKTIPCRDGCPHGAYLSADRTNRCLGCGLIAPSDCNCTTDAAIWRIFGPITSEVWGKQDVAGFFDKAAQSAEARRQEVAR